ncbi:Multidrug resistance-associated protein 9 [Phlyctochytrium planicorne]|nr:Multidrug resistance-associated protein 9 [Phlyctochytrium planicorne]
MSKASKDPQKDDFMVSNDQGPETGGKKADKEHIVNSKMPKDSTPPKNSLKDMEESAGPSPEATANLFSKAVLEWLTKLMVLASRRVLMYQDLFDMEPRHDSNRLGRTADSILQQTREEYKTSEDASKSPEDMSSQVDEGLKDILKRKLFSILFSLYKWEWFAGGVACILGAVAGIMSPIVLQYVIRFLQDPSAPAWKGYGLCILLFALQITQTLCVNTYRKINSGIGRNNSAYDFNSQFIVRHWLEKYNDECRLSKIFASLFSIPPRTIVNSKSLTFEKVLAMSAVLISYLKYGGVAGVGFMLLVAFSQQWIMRKIYQFEALSLKSTDSRVRLATEMISGMKVIKLFAWEDSFLERINEVRTLEMSRQFKLTILSSIFYGLTFVIPSLVAVVSFSVYSAIPGNTLSAEIVFPALALIGLLRVPIMELPSIIVFALEMTVSLGRIARFLAAPELDIHASAAEMVADSTSAIYIDNATFLWKEWTGPSDAKDGKKSPSQDNKKGDSKDKETDSDKKKLMPSESAETLVDNEDTSKLAENSETNSSFGLNDITISLVRGRINAVVGPVGAGKSSLLQAILGEMPKIKGNVSIGGTIAYSPQQGWLLNTSLKDNILFGSPLDEQRYKLALWACALDKDIVQFPDGDQTEVGERGVTLSGGQAARVNLARSLYSTADILFLDDPLAAVDAHVGKHIFDNGICGPLRQGRTIVLVTHQLHVLPNVGILNNIVELVDHVFYLEKGRIVEHGTYSSLIGSTGGFSKLMAEYGGVSEDTADRKDPKELEQQDEAPLDAEKDKTEVEAPKALMVQEEREQGAVRLHHYRIYFAATGGLLLWISVTVWILILQGVRVLNDYWLVFWSNDQFQLQNAQYILFYTLLGVIQGIGATVLAVVVSFAGFRGSRVLHQKAIHRVAHAPMSFFETNPMGRIVNRFSSDMAEVDRWLIVIVRGAMITFASVISTIVLIGYVVPLVFVVVVPTVPLYYYVQKFYRNASREMKRLESVGRSPLFSQFSEALQGLPTIRAFKSAERFIQRNQALINIANRPSIMRYYVGIWVAFRMEFFVAVICFAVAAFGIAFKVSPALLGLAIGYTLSLTQTLNSALRLMSETEGRMNCVERLNYYGNEIPNEAPMDLPGGKQQPVTWPEHGAMELKSVDLRYRPELPLVLKGISVSIKPGEKIGIVGRTGAGKSSVISAIYRLVELSGGSIHIDGVDISRIGLRDLRTKLSIIPQMPILFEGTIRSNMDHTGKKSDTELWEVLEAANLKDYVSSLENKLDSKVQENGENLSVGQRQLLCLARAMLVHPKILLIDEATASVDIKTDTSIQKALRESFRSSTIVTVAHRLITIIDYDRILVLKNGEVAEFDSPKNLLETEGGIFSDLVNETGPSNAALLRRLAEEGFGDFNLEQVINVEV